MNVATALVWIGSALFLVGAAIAVPRVFTEPDRERKLRMLQAGLRRWRFGQPLYAVGALVAAAGVGFLPVTAVSGSGQAALTTSCALLSLGAVCWSWSVYQRFRSIREFALGELPGWPFAWYVRLTLLGLGCLGIGLLAADFPAWSGWAALAGAVGILIAYVRFGDIPPFVFYLLLPAVSLGWG